MSAITATGALLPADSMEQRMAYFAIFFFAGHWLAMRLFADEGVAVGGGVGASVRG